LKLLAALIPADWVPSEVVIALRPATLLLALGISVIVTLLCGLVPALRVIRRDLHTGLTGSTRGTSGEFRHGKLRSALVIIEVALSIVLLIATGLMVRTLQAPRTS
jgi:hypothetical protein